MSRSFDIEKDRMETESFDPVVWSLVREHEKALLAIKDEEKRHGIYEQMDHMLRQKDKSYAKGSYTDFKGKIKELLAGPEQQAALSVSHQKILAKLRDIPENALEAALRDADEEWRAVEKNHADPDFSGWSYNEICRRFHRILKSVETSAKNPSPPPKLPPVPPPLAKLRPGPAIVPAESLTEAYADLTAVKN